MAVRELTDNPADGSRMGKDSSEKLAFWGATPGARPSTATAVATTAITAVVSTAITAVVTTAVTTGTTNNALYGFTTSTQAAALITAVNDLITRGALQTIAANSLITQSAANLTAINTLKTNLDTIGLQG